MVRLATVVVCLCVDLTSQQLLSSSKHGWCVVRTRTQPSGWSTNIRGRSRYPPQYPCNEAYILKLTQLLKGYTRPLTGLDDSAFVLKKKKIDLRVSNRWLPNHGRKVLGDYSYIFFPTENDRWITNIFSYLLYLVVCHCKLQQRLFPGETQGMQVNAGKCVNRAVHPSLTCRCYNINVLKYRHACPLIGRRGGGIFAERRR